MFLEVQEQEIVTTVYRVVAGESDVIRTYPTKAEADAFAAGWNQAADEATLYEEQPEPVEAAEEPEQIEELEEAVAETIEQPDDLPAFEQEYVYLSDSPADDEVTEDTEPLVEAL